MQELLPPTVTGTYWKAFRVWPNSFAALKQVEPVAVGRELPGYFRQPWGEGWVLVGDAAYHKHPLSAQGITDAFRDADLLSEALDEGFSGRCQLHDSLADYERRRNAAVMPMYESTCARMQPLPPHRWLSFGHCVKTSIRWIGFSVRMQAPFPWRNSSRPIISERSFGRISDGKRAWQTP